VTLTPLVRSIVDASLDATSVVNRDLEVLYFNAQYLHLAGLRPRAMRGRTARGMCHEHFELDACDEGCVSLRAFLSGRPCRVDEVVSGRMPLRLIVVAVPLVGDSGEVFAVMERYRDVTAESRLQENYRRLLEQERSQKLLLAAEVARQTVELQRTNASLRVALAEVSRMARTDGLSGLANRRHFDEQLANLILLSKRNGEPLGLVIFDLDHFKQINDGHGHPAGDTLLREFSTCLRSVTRPVDVVARIGGEEFALLLPGVDAEGAARIARRVQETARKAALMTTASAGVAAFPSDGLTCSELHRGADRALYAAKRAGRDRVYLVGDLSSPGEPPEGEPPARKRSEQHVA